MFSEAASGLEEVLNDIRELSRGIHPAVLSRAGLGPALRRLGAALRFRSTSRCAFPHVQRSGSRLPSITWSPRR